MIMMLGLLLWIAALGATARLFLLARRNWLQGYKAWLFAAIITVGAVFIMFRPHEDLYGGEDPGSYVNSAFTYARTGAFFHTDPLLADMPSAYRPAFFYGHANFGLTKDACLWVRDLDNALIGPRFLPAYPLLMSTLVKLGLSWRALYVTPFFTLLTALTLAALAAQLFPNTKLTPIAAPLLYLLSPLIFWHGRCPRPELAASFFLFAGAFFMLNAWQKGRWNAWIDILLAGLCVGLAPFFHPTAWQLAIPLGVSSVLVALLGGRDDFALYPPIAAACGALFLAQQYFLTDAYRVLRNVSFIINHPAITALITLCACAALWGAALLVRRKFSFWLNPPFQITPKTQGIIRLCLFGLTILLFLASVVARDFFGRNMPPLLSQYLTPVDFATLSRMISLPVILLVLFGWSAWWLDPEANWIERAILGLIVLPALVLTGLVVDFMSTRYYVVSIVPVCVMALCGLIAFARKLEFRRRQRPFLLLPMLAIMLFLQIHGRTHLLTLIEHRGFYHFLADVARAFAKPGALLLAEYSRLAAPFEHIFGVPTLGLDQHRHDSYENAEWAWEFIMRQQPEAEAFFMTPFQPPISQRFFFEPLTVKTFPRQFLQQARLGLPTQTRKDVLRVSVYRMRLRQQPGNQQPPPVSLPQSRVFAEGNMGIRGFGPTLHKEWAAHAIELAPNEPLMIPVPNATELENPREGLIICNVGKESSRFLPPHLEFDKPIPSYSEKWTSIQGGWCALQFAGAEAFTGRSIWLRARDRIAVADMFFINSSNMLSTIHAVMDKPSSRIALGINSARWTRNNACFFIPASGSSASIFLALLAQFPKAQTPMSFGLLADAKPFVSNLIIDPGAWQWRCARLPAGALSNDMWIETVSQPTWDPGELKYPPDLGAIMACVAILPVIAPKSKLQNTATNSED